MQNTLCKLDTSVPQIKDALESNRHTVQFFCYNSEPKPPYHSRSSPQRVLDSTVPRLLYDSKAFPVRTTIHLGQRKLHLTEVEFFLEKLSPLKKYIVVYAGAAPGSHTVLLRKMFRNIKFHLVDPAPFDPTLKGLSRITLQNTYFDDNVAKELSQKYNKKRLIFISDIRCSTSEDSIRHDMEHQEKWVNIMQPKHSMLKFRLPWDMDHYSYLDGEIRFQPFPPLRSTETRLLVDRVKRGTLFPRKKYDTRLYEDQCFYHNIVQRSQYYDHPYQVPYMDHCYDCTVEFKITKRYLQSPFNNGVFKHFSVVNMVQHLTGILKSSKLKNTWIQVINNNPLKTI